MGSGFAGNPPDEGTSLTPAADVPPESFVGVDDIAAGATEVAAGIAGSALIKDAVKILKVGGEIALLVFLLTHTKQILDLWRQYVAPHIKDVAEDILSPIVDLLQPVGDALGTLAGAYVGETSRHWEMEKGGNTKSTGTPVGNAAQIAFDSIINPIVTFVQGAPPNQKGAGQQNFQQTLGVIVQLHLVTWVVNIISNLAGIGVLKYINSFNTCILDALNARNLSRLGMKPYVDTFIATPLQQDMNRAWPIKVPGDATYIKQFIRGGIAQSDLQDAMATLGYNPQVTAQLLLDTAHLMSVGDVAFVVRNGTWTTQQGVDYLKQAGYDDATAPVVLHQAVYSLVYDNNKKAADAMGTHYAKGEVDDATYRAFLSALQFNDLEIQSYITIYGMELDFPKGLTYSQLQAAYKLGIIDLDYVQNWMVQNQNGPDEVNILTLLDFTETSQLTARQAALAATARVQAVKAAADAQTALNKGEAALAAAYQAQADAKAALAAKYGK